MLKAVKRAHLTTPTDATPVTKQGKPGGKNVAVHRWKSAPWSRTGFERQHGICWRGQRQTQPKVKRKVRPQDMKLAQVGRTVPTQKLLQSKRKHNLLPSFMPSIASAASGRAFPNTSTDISATSLFLPRSTNAKSYGASIPARPRLPAHWTCWWWRRGVGRLSFECKLCGIGARL